MIIALDYDGTYTEDPVFWSGMARAATARGHRVIMVTMRRPDELVPVDDLEVVYTSRMAKVPFMEAAGQRVDVWIDDSPHWLLQNGA